ncbi:hypothetical protein RK813_07865, partial [Streptococcus pneumoniae]|nr:hypothetical protein [Streptococcus pneumoniae]
GLFFYTKIGSIISIRDLPTTNIIEPNNKKKKCLIDIKHFFLCLPLSKKMIIDIIVNKNPDRFCMIEKVKKTMAENR